MIREKIQFVFLINKKINIKPIKEIVEVSDKNFEEILVRFGAEEYLQLDVQGGRSVVVTVGVIFILLGLWGLVNFTTFTSFLTDVFLVILGILEIFLFLATFTRFLVQTYLFHVINSLLFCVWIVSLAVCDGSWWWLIFVVFSVIHMLSSWQKYTFFKHFLTKMKNPLSSSITTTP
jgi:hypothetical protein